jgi:hypothetical protein
MNVQILKNQMPKIMSDKSLLLLAVIVFLSVWSTGCGPSKQQQSRMDLQRGSLEGVKMAIDRSRKARDDFFNCTNDYARNNARTSASPLELSEAAVSECRYELGKYGMSRSEYHFYNSMVNAMSIEDIEEARSKGEKDARLDVQKVVDEGRILVLRIVLEIRQ